MSDIDHEDEFDKAFEGFGEDKPAEEPKKTDDTPKSDEPKKTDEAPKEEPKKDDKPAEEPKKDEEKPADDKPADDGKKQDDTTEKPVDGEKPNEQEEPKPLTKEDVADLISNMRAEDRTSARALEDQTQSVLEAYYPDGLSNVLIDQNTGKELRTPQDVVDASGGSMTIEEASQWLMNEQYALDSNIAKIKDDAKKIAETTLNFKRDATLALQKYEPLFKWKPSLQNKVYGLLMQQVKSDVDKGVIISSPDVMAHYDLYLEPYQREFELSQGQPATNPVTPPAAPEPPKPTADDRLDENGDGGASTEVDDPNDFAQQVKKELSRGL